MITPFGDRFETIPAPYFKVLEYIPDNSTEVVWGGGTIISGSGDTSSYFLWANKIGAVVHGTNKIFWVCDASFGNFGNVFGHYPGTDQGERVPISETMGPLDGELDELIAMRQNDLWRRQEFEEEMGRSFLVRSHSNLITHFSGYMGVFLENPMQACFISLTGTDDNAEGAIFPSGGGIPAFLQLPSEEEEP